VRKLSNQLYVFNPSISSEVLILFSFYLELVSMPNKPLKPCNKAGCHELTRESYCEQHKKEKHQYDKNRGTAAQRGYGAKWRKARKYYLSANPLCVKCREEDKLSVATVVDHITPHKGDKGLFWDQNNWAALCASCHSRKTVQEDGGFGND
jgi:5-methylcytosine-specific restriction protein A